MYGMVFATYLNVTIIKLSGIVSKDIMKDSLQKVNVEIVMVKD